jgi:flagellar hook-length control protein FliK
MDALEPSAELRSARARQISTLLERLGREGEEASGRLSPARLPQHTLRLIEGLRRDGSRFYRASVELNPPELGRVRIELRMEKAALWARFVVESAGARDQIQAELPRLRAALAAQDLGNARIDVQVGDQGRHDPGTRPEADLAGTAWPKAAAAPETPRFRASLHEGFIDTRA